MSARKRSKHRYLYNKPALIREATAELVRNPDDEPSRQYLRGLCDAMHGTDHEPTARAVHVARQTIIATKEV
jgi:hypothetical protein